MSLVIFFKILFTATKNFEIFIDYLTQFVISTSSQSQTFGWVIRNLRQITVIEL